MHPPTDPTEGRAQAIELDELDGLASFRDQFVIDDDHLIYVDGNSLGRLPKRTVDRARTFVEDEWGTRLIRGWGEGWMRSPETVGDKIARLIGAEPGEVIVADSTTVCFLKLAIAALRGRPDRTVTLTDDLNFPSDLYAIEEANMLVASNKRVEVIESVDGIHGPVDELLDRIDQDTALVTLSHTVFKSGFTYDMAAMNAAAHAVGALVLWDLSHSVGSVPIDLGGSGADLAVGCTYKYLNGGPGAPAFLYVRRELQAELANPLVGWMGHADRFAFETGYRPSISINQFLTGTPSAVAVAMVEMGVDLVLEAGMDRLRSKSEAQVAYLEQRCAEHLVPRGFTIKSPTDVSRRGSHLTIGHEHALGIDLALINELDVIPDFRAPDNIRLGIAPLYVSFADLHEVVVRLARVIDEERWSAYGNQMPDVS